MDERGTESRIMEESRVEWMRGDHWKKEEEGEGEKNRKELCKIVNRVIRYDSHR